MKFMITWASSPANSKATLARFTETGGSPPQGVTMLGRWHAPHNNRGFVLAETDDAKALYEWVNQWNDLLEFNLAPVIEDAELTEVLKRTAS
jgi:Protein of unknown function (DUF3303)